MSETPKEKVYLYLAPHYYAEKFLDKEFEREIRWKIKSILVEWFDWLSHEMMYKRIATSNEKYLGPFQIDQKEYLKRAKRNNIPIFNAEYRADEVALVKKLRSNNDVLLGFWQQPFDDRNSYTFEKKVQVAKSYFDLWWDCLKERDSLIIKNLYEVKKPTLIRYWTKHTNLKRVIRKAWYELNYMMTSHYSDHYSICIQKSFYNMPISDIEYIKGIICMRLWEDSRICNYLLMKPNAIQMTFEDANKDCLMYNALVDMYSWDLSKIYPRTLKILLSEQWLEVKSNNKITMEEVTNLIGRYSQFKYNRPVLLDRAKSQWFI